MNSEDIYLIPPWQRYSKKLIARIENPKNAGFFNACDAQDRGMRLVIGKKGSVSKGQQLHLYFLIDESDGIISDAKFQAFGLSVLIGAADAVCEILLRKNYDQAKRIGVDLIDHFLRDKNEKNAFPEEAIICLNDILAAIEHVAEQCLDIPFAESYVTPPMPGAGLSLTAEGIYPGWEDLNTEQKITIIERVIMEDIRPYIELDAGGIRIVSFENDRNLIIAYEGACTSCHSATGATLNAIQQILSAKVHPDIIVTPDMSFLQQ